jgi:hypothetical protein
VEENHAHAEPSAAASTPASQVVTWLICASVLLLCIGVAAAFHIQFGNNPFRREGAATLVLLTLGVTGIALSIAFAPL